MSCMNSVFIELKKTNTYKCSVKNINEKQNIIVTLMYCYKENKLLVNVLFSGLFTYNIMFHRPLGPGFPILVIQVNKTAVYCRQI